MNECPLLLRIIRCLRSQVHTEQITKVRKRASDNRQGRKPNFDNAEQAFYYVRALEIPTPRWTAYNAKRFNIKMGPEVLMITQERVYTSPIWYAHSVYPGEGN